MKNKKTMQVILPVALVLIGVTAFAASNAMQSRQVDTNPSTSNATNIGASSTQLNTQPTLVPVTNSDVPKTARQPEPGSAGQGQYVVYSDGIIDKTEGTKILFFHASWCTQCRDLEKDIKAKGVPAGVTIIKVDYENSQDLKKKYEVKLQTTLVKVDDNGNLLKKYVAYQEPSVQSVIENLL